MSQEDIYSKNFKALSDVSDGLLNYNKVYVKYVVLFFIRTIGNFHVYVCVCVYICVCVDFL